MLTTTKRKVLGDLTNSPKRSPVSPRYGEEIDAAKCLLGLFKASPYPSKTPDLPTRLPSSSSDNLDEIRCVSQDHMKLDPVSGLLVFHDHGWNFTCKANRSVPQNDTCPGVPLNQSSRAAKEKLVLDAETGLFRRDEETSEGCQENSNDESDKTNPHQESNIVEELLLKIEMQEKMLADLQKSNEIKDQKIQDLLHFRDTDQRFRIKYETVRKAKERLEAQQQQEELHSPKSPYLRDSQLKRIFRKSNRGIKWEPEDIRDGLIFKMACGTRSYGKIVSSLPVWPSVRSLQNAVQFVKFDSGILHEVFDLMKAMSQGMSEMEKECELVLDEMAVEPGLRYCHSLKKWVGGSTLKSHDGNATKALTFLLAGISRRWKIAVAVEFTNKMTMAAKAEASKKGNPTGKEYAAIIKEIATKTEAIGLHLSNVTSDMGPDNLAFWKEFNVTGQKNIEVKASFPNPGRPGEEIYVMPDAVHLWKAIKKMMQNNKVFELPQDIVKEEGLSSPFVEYKHIEDLMEFENNFELKVAFRLKEENVHCDKQFKTMSVGTTRAVLNQRTGVGLKKLGERKGDSTYATTAWFVMFLNTMFLLFTSRSRGLAISKHNPVAYQKAIDLIKKMDYIFHNMKVGQPGNPQKRPYKPAQRGVRVLCYVILKLINRYLGEKKWNYLMLSRFTSDCIENLFSLLRLRQPVPHCVIFLQCLKVVTLAQYSEAVKGSSYDHEDCSSLSSNDFLEEARKRAKERSITRFYVSLQELFANPLRKLTNDDLAWMDDWERCVVYDMAGSAVASVLSSNMTVCDICVNALKWKNDALHPSASVTFMKEFLNLREEDASPLQIYVTDPVFIAILTAEVSFRLFRDRTLKFENADVKAYFVENLMYVWEGCNIPDCHQLGRKVLTNFIDARLKIFGNLLKECSKPEKSTVHRSSKSVAMRHEVKDMLSTPVQSNAAQSK